MPVVTECDDSFLNDVTSFPLAEADVFAALDEARTGDVAEGCVGAGTGMQCMDFKGGIGTASGSSAAGPSACSTLTNFGERELLLIDGVPVGREITDLMPAGALGGLVHRRGRDRRADGAAPGPAAGRCARGSDSLGAARPGTMARASS